MTYEALIKKLMLNIDSTDMNTPEFEKKWRMLNEAQKIVTEQEKNVLNSKKEKRHEKVQLILGVLGIAASMGVQIWAFSNVLNFEVNNTFTSSLGRILISKIGRS